MVVPETEPMSSQGEAKSSLPATKSDRNQKHTNHNNSSNSNSMALLGRQSSIFSLTLDEFQHTLSESGKNFGSMNMDEFLTSIWTAEENQQQQQPRQHGNTIATSSFVNGSGQQSQLLALSDFLTSDKGGGGGDGAVARQQSLSRQGSLSVPAPLCRKTVEEVWSEIHKKGATPEKQRTTNHHHNQHPHHHHHQQQQQKQHDDNNNSDAGSGRGKSAQRATQQPTFGEMTLEDFLIKAGVVREHGAPAAAAASVGAAALQPQVQPYAVGPVFVGAYGGRVGNGYGVGPVSPVSSDGMCGSQAENDSSGHFGMEMGVFQGRKRVIDGPVEKVVERRQRRMIKNRESAARSRARKQAYTVELEAELNQLREENERLKHAVAEGERKKERLYVEEMKIKTQNQAEAYKAKEKVRLFRRNLSCPL